MSMVVKFKHELARVLLFGLLPLFLLPAIGWLFSGHAIAELDGRVLAAIEHNIDADPGSDDAYRAQAHDFFRAHLASSTCNDDDPQFDNLRRQVCERYGDMWQFLLVRQVTAIMLVAGVAVLLAALALGAYAFRNRGAQYLSFVLGWRLFTATAVVETVLQGALLVWLSFWVTAVYFQTYSVKLIAVAAVVVVLTVMAVIAALFSRAPQNNTLEGELLGEDDAPALWSHVRQMAASLGTAPPDNIVAGIDANFFVAEVPLTLAGRALDGRSLFVSLPLLRLLFRDEADAVLAHELGHFSGGDTSSGARLVPKLLQYDFYCHQLRESGFGLPWASFMRIYRVLFELALRRDGREREFLADAVAARLVSADALVRALIKVAAYALYRGAVERGLFSVSEQLGTSLGIAERIDRGLAPFALSDDFASAMGQAPVPHPFDSHPPLVERMARVDVSVAPETFGSVVTATRGASWVSDIVTADAIETRLWAVYEQRFANQHEHTLAYRYLPANEQEAAVVMKYFPNVGFTLKKGGRLGISFQGIHPPDGSEVVPWHLIVRMSFENPTFGSFRLEIYRRRNAEGGRTTTVIKMPGMMEEKDKIGRVLSHYWQRDQVARQHHA